MKSDQDLIAQIDKLFHPRSVAVVGAPRGMKTGTVFLMALLEQGFSGPIYPVNPQAEEINGIKAYPKVADIPGPVDLAIILVPHWNSIAVVKECADKGGQGSGAFYRRIQRNRNRRRQSPGGGTGAPVR
jgi:acyl-CoA synthetase (NDP forming)